MWIRLACHSGDRSCPRVEGLKVGVVWQGNPNHTRDRERSFRLAQLEPLARIPGVRLLSLQKYVGVEQIGDVADRFDVDRPGASHR